MSQRFEIHSLRLSYQSVQVSIYTNIHLYTVRKYKLPYTYLCLRKMVLDINYNAIVSFQNLDKKLVFLSLIWTAHKS